MAVFDLGSDEATQARQEILNNDKPVVNETNKDDSQKVEQALQQVNGDPDKPETKEEVKVVLDGPLSQIYTQALNLVYAKEDTGQQVVALTQQDDQVQKTDGVYLYCCNGDALDQEALIETTNAIQSAQEHYKNILVAIECRSGIISDKIGLLDNFARSMGIQVYLTRQSALEGVKTALESTSK